MKIATITHDSTGCRIDLGTGGVHLYANVSYVAEALAREMLAGVDQRKRVDRIRETLNRYLNHSDSEGVKTVRLLIDDVRKILDEDVPF